VTDEEKYRIMIARCEAEANLKMMAIAIELRRRAVAKGHTKAIQVCDRYIGGDASAGDDIQQGMRSWDL